MEGPNSIELVVAAGNEGLAAVLVGGNAVNLYAYLRTTFDVDLLIREEDRTAWILFFERHGYATFHATANFIRMRFAADPASALPVDLMLADLKTFEKISRESELREIAAGIRIGIPKPLHLIAMKLHALRNPTRVELGLDFQDIKHLIAAAKIDPATPEFRDILERYASEPIRTRLLHDLGIA